MQRRRQAARAVLRPGHQQLLDEERVPVFLRRPWIRATSSVVGVEPRIVSTSSRVRERSSRDSSMRSTRPVRSSSASHGSNG